MRSKINPLSRIAAALRKLFERENRIVAVEADGNIIKVVEALKLDGAQRLVRIEGLPIQPGDAASVSRAMGKLFAGRKPASRVVELNIPRHNLTMRLVKLPSTDDAELRQIISMESLKHIPYSAEDVIFGYRIVEKLADGYSQVQLVIAQAKLIKELINAAELAGLIVSSVRAGSEALLAWYLAAVKGESKENVLVINIDSNYLDMAVIEGGILIFTRGVSYGSREPMTMDGMMEQIKLSINSYHKDSAKSIERALVTGLAEKAVQLKDAIGMMVAMPVAAIDQAEGAVLDDVQKSAIDSASFAGLLGIAWNKEEMKIDLTPENVREASRVALLKKSLLITVCLILAACVLATGIILKKIHDKAAAVEYINSELKRIDPSVRKARGMIDNMNAINAAVSLRPRAIDILGEVGRVTPQGVLITMLSYESQKTVAVRGTAPSLGEVFKYVIGLEKSPQLESVKIKYANKRATANAELVDFEISGNISKVK